MSLGLGPPVCGLGCQEERGVGVLEAELGVLPRLALLLQDPLELPQLLHVVPLLLLPVVLLRDDAGAALGQLLLQPLELLLPLRSAGGQAGLQLLRFLLQLALVGLETGLHARLLLRDGGQGAGERAELAPRLRQAALRLRAGAGRLRGRARRRAGVPDLRGEHESVAELA